MGAAEKIKLKKRERERWNAEKSSDLQLLLSSDCMKSPTRAGNLCCQNFVKKL